MDRSARSLAIRALVLGFAAAAVLGGTSSGEPPREALRRFASAGYESGGAGEEVRLLVDGRDEVAGFASAADARRVRITLQAECALEADPGARLRVRVFLDGEPLPSGDAVLCRSDSGASARHWRTGRATLDVPRLPAGAHTLEADAWLEGTRRGFFRIQRKELVIALRADDQRAVGMR